MKSATHEAVTSLWHVADVVSARDETANARTLGLRVDGVHGNTAGQHVDIRVTADDGYSAVRSYSIATAGTGDYLEVTVDKLTDGEVSPYLVDGVTVGDKLEIRGPVGGWFVWRPADPGPVQLIAGGSGIVPLMAMIRSHEAARSTSAFRLLYSVRSPATTIYRDELAGLAGRSATLTVDMVYTRAAPDGWPSEPRRLDADTLYSRIMPVTDAPQVFICGQTIFVETVAEWLVAAGYAAGTIKTERYGGTGGTS
ncbi:ferredoxin reductase [Glaciibacter sp. 2TAF33]|uniref:ferredoxin reductase n=1 Tax=Glaciibacter sp. 2TAF33 TaxID=3233015 RepID=UPI003F91E974